MTITTAVACALETISKYDVHIDKEELKTLISLSSLYTINVRQLCSQARKADINYYPQQSSERA